MTTWFLIIMGWLLCAFVAYGIGFAELQADFPRTAKENRRKDMGFSMFFSLLGGPVWLVVIFFHSGFCEHGWKLK